MTSAGFPVRICQTSHGILERFDGRHDHGGLHTDFQFARSVGYFYSRTRDAVGTYRLPARRYRGCAGNYDFFLGSLLSCHIVYLLSDSGTVSPILVHSRLHSHQKFLSIELQGEFPHTRPA
jgi:hypothetical protein